MDNNAQRLELFKLAKFANKQIQARSVFLQGLFLKDPITFHDKIKPLLKYIHLLQRIADETGKKMYELAIAYVLLQERIDFFLIGIDSCDQLKQNLAALNCNIKPEYADKIDRIVVAEKDLLYPYNWS